MCARACVLVTCVDVRVFFEYVQRVSVRVVDVNVCAFAVVTLTLLPLTLVVAQLLQII